MAQLFFFPAEKISAEIFLKKIFSEKKLNKKVVLAGSLAKFLNRLKVPFARQILGVRFCQENREKCTFFLCFAMPKIVV